MVLAIDASENMVGATRFKFPSFIGVTRLQISKARSSWRQIPNIEFRLEDAAHLPSHLGPSSIEKVFKLF